MAGAENTKITTMLFFPTVKKGNHYLFIDNCYYINYLKCIRSFHPVICESLFWVG